MIEQFVTHEIAKALKELGFNERCFACYAYGGEDHIIFAEKYNDNNKGYTAVPLWQQAIDWLRKIHNIEVIPMRDYNGTKYRALVFRGVSDYPPSDTTIHYNSFEEARGAGLLAGLNKIEQQQKPKTEP